MARKRATSKAQLIHAQAAPAAQLVTAHAQTQTASAPTATASAPTASRRRGASVNPALPAPVQVGGEKQHHQGFGTQTATVGGTDLSLHQLRDGSYELRDPNGNVRRRYSGGQMANVTRRGNSGATMDPLDSAAFFRIGGGKTADEKAEEQRQQIRQEKTDDQIAAEKRNNEEWTRRNKIQNQQQIETEGRNQTQWFYRQNEIQRRKQEEEARLKKQAEAENAAFNTKYGIDEGTQLSQKDKDDIAAGRSRWGYSAQDQQSIDDINKAFSEGKYDRTKKGYYVGDDGLAHQLKEGDSGHTGQDLITEHDAFRHNADAQIAGFRKGVQKNTDERTAEQIYNGAFEINGVRYYSPDGRSLVPIDEGQKAQAARDARAQERADNQAFRQQERTDKFIDSTVTELMKPKAEIGNDGKPTGEEIAGMTYEDAYAEAVRRSKIRNGQQPNPNGGAGAGTPPPNPSATDWRNNPLFN